MGLYTLGFILAGPGNDSTIVAYFVRCWVRTESYVPVYSKGLGTASQLMIVRLQSGTRLHSYEVFVWEFRNCFILFDDLFRQTVNETVKVFL